MNFLFVLAVLIIGVGAASEQQNDRLIILADYGVTVDEEMRPAELKLALAKMLPDVGSVTALESKFKFIFQDQPEVLRSLDDEFERYQKIESDPALQIAEVERLKKAKEDRDLIEFWLDRLAIAGDAHIDRAEWYLKRNEKSDVQRAYDWYRKAQSLGRNVTKELRMLEGRFEQ